MADEKSADLLRRLYALNRQIGDLERQLLGREKVGFDGKFGSDVRYTWTRDDDGLSPLMRRFIEEYPKDLNATASTIRAGYSEKGAAVRGNWLLRQRKVVEALKKEFKRVTERNEIDVDSVITEVGKIAFSNIADFVKWDDDRITFVPSKYLSRTDTACIKEVSERRTPKTRIVTIKLYDKPHALLTLCRYLGILDPEANQKDSDDYKEQARQIRGFLNQIESSVPPSQVVKPSSKGTRRSPLRIEKFGKKLETLEQRLDKGGKA